MILPTPSARRVGNFPTTNPEHPSGAWLLGMLLCCALSGSQSVAVDSIDFVRDVRPIFEAHCYSCHGPEKQKSGLRLDIKSAAFRGGEAYGDAVRIDDPKASPILEWVSSSDPQHRMPPDGAPLSEEQITIIQRWIEQGAPWPDGVDTSALKDPREHWSFQPLHTLEGDHSIDSWINEALRTSGLTMAPPASRVDWLRRVTLDLHGLPPSPEQISDFALDPFDEAFEDVVDTLLASPRYGERWAQQWLDVVRYADTHGFEVNTERPNAWHYRDYVIDALNRDVPYDQFIREQIAGDQLDSDAATGFLITASVLLPGQIGADEPSKRLARQDALDEIVVNVGQTFLGLSVGCARCHDHKFDPITQKEYYAMQAFVAGVEYGDRELRTSDARDKKKAAEALEAKLKEIDIELACLEPLPYDSNATQNTVPLPPTEGLSSEESQRRIELLEIRAQLEMQHKGLIASQLAFAGIFRKPDAIHVLYRGDPEQPKDPVSPRVPAFLGNLNLANDVSDEDRRIALANWIASPENPLTARVIVNRIWQGHFGVGLVATPNDFGMNGLPPSHPELLDWLAQELMRSGWSMKSLHKKIVLSNAYRQASEINADAMNKDVDDRLLWRYPRRRLEAEMIRDSMLAVSGRLDFKMHGRGFNLFDQRGGLSGFKPIESFAEEGRRRMIYAHKVRRERDAVFGAFDCPDAGQSTAIRRVSTTPIQALNLFNSPFTLEQSKAFAERSHSMAGADPTQQIKAAYLLALGRNPSTDEIADAMPVLTEHSLEVLCRVLFNCNEFLFFP